MSAPWVMSGISVDAIKTLELTALMSTTPHSPWRHKGAQDVLRAIGLGAKGTMIGRAFFMA